METRTELLDPALPRLHISMLGRFELRVGDLVIGDDSSRSRKMWNILAYILTHRNKGISQQEFIDVLWPEEESLKPSNALKTLLYRIRILLEPIEKAYGGKELLLSRWGSYCWNKEIPCIIDAEEFETLCRRAGEETRPANERIRMYQEALAIYIGGFLPKLTMELWVAPMSMLYHSMYLDAAKKLAALLQDAGRYEEMAQVCMQAIGVDSLDEQLHCLLVLALIRQGKDAAALAHYETATDLLYRNLGVKPSRELRALYSEIMKMQKSLETDLGVIQEHLKEAEAVPGAFICEYGYFKEAYRLEARRAARYGMSVFIGLITVATPSGEVPTLDLLNETMDQLLDVLKKSLRKGDVVSRYSGAQFVLMLPALTYEDGENVMNRVLGNFYKLHRKNFLKLHYKLQQLELHELR